MQASYEYEGCNMSPEEPPDPFDHHCPQMGKGLNMYRSECLKRAASDKSWNSSCHNPCTYKHQRIPPKPKNTTMEKSYLLFDEGKTVDDVVLILNRKLSTVIGYHVYWRKARGVKVTKGKAAVKPEEV